jgi:NIMA (never in mitosis gene a)-related kinase
MSVLTTMGYAEDHLHPLPEGFTDLVAFGVNKAPTAEARKLLRLVIPPKPADAEGVARSVRSFDPDTYSLFRALQTSRDYASYEKVRLLGRGTQGTAVLLRAPPDSVPEGRVSEVVAKCISVSDELPDAELKRIEAEVKLLRKLRHKHVISYVGAFFSSGLISILTEYASGGALHSHIVTAGRTSAPFATGRIRRWIGELAVGLQFIHDEGVLHRDLSPKNLLVGNADEILIADFGWSTVIGPQLSGSQHLATTFAGTPYYMAPEVLLGQPYSRPADVWSVGVVLYQLLTLARPYKASGLEELTEIVQTHPVGLEPDEMLSKCGHPEELCQLATMYALLNTEQDERMKLPTLIDRMQAFSDAS